MNTVARTLIFVAALSALCVACSQVPDYIPKETLRVSPPAQWPEAVRAAASRFSELPQTNRLTEARIIAGFLNEFRPGRSLATNGTELTQSQTITILGTPDFQNNHEMGYFVGEEPGAKGCLMLYYRNQRLAKVEVGHFDGPVKEMKPEQAGSGYPPQGVGSPDP